MKKKECKKDCKCKVDGKTHSFNDGCGCPMHNGEEFESKDLKEECKCGGGGVYNVHLETCNEPKNPIIQMDRKKIKERIKEILLAHSDIAEYTDEMAIRDLGKLYQELEN